MKKSIISLALALVAATAFFGCSKKEAVLKVGATPEPHAEMLNLIKDDLAKEGIKLQVIEFTDYVIPNESLESGEIDANFFQHLPYLESFNTERSYHLVSAGGIHIEPFALYSKKITSLSQLADGATIAIPNDPTNGGRALLLLQSAGLISLNPAAGVTATTLDITSNPKNLKFSEIEEPAPVHRSTVPGRSTAGFPHAAPRRIRSTGLHPGKAHGAHAESGQCV